MAQVILDPIDPGAREDVDHLVKAPAEYAHFVHYNWFWHDRAIGDPDIHYSWILNNERRSGVIAFGLHETRDLDPKSRLPDVGEVYHVVIDENQVRLGLAKAAIAAAVRQLDQTLPVLSAVVVAHHPDNQVAALLYASLGFVPNGRRRDGETGEEDILQLLDGPALRTLIESS